MAERYDGPLRNRIGDGELVDYAGRVVGMYYVDSIDSPTPPQDATDAGDGVNPASRPAEPSLVALDAGDEALRALLAWREADRLYPPEEPEAWPALARLRDVADRLGLAR